MGQLSSKIRKVQGGFSHWCPACQDMHFFRLRVEGVQGPSWLYDMNHECPTFRPSMNIGHDSVRDEEDPNIIIPGYRCHYHLRAGVISYCDDCTHAMRNMEVPLPDLPPEYQDKVVTE